ncbi:MULTISPECIES: sarcosine oxidase subunit gamma family protein [Rhizobium/Agrobacterium group]|uniref:Sarcosine oxidase subunit gamma family protein n=1 Tax=Neorhizobium petrolearium TaxID=515361 RepID=A0ABY8LW07_9HYPH|nr:MULTISPECIES: sarcosine oxidase subunit gamma family protein [Rhizobium/Agrobacterium group]KGD99913.1 sarcosine oxidase subunit gamma [Rhizobium sp. YS-1r]MCC2611307.1 sarcosine oxidase subunit gamma [Neorhizobium petrolearium]WGI66507.1 sarcosine oxidase subunit gamma family protein [Neorhizobium petrolearium]
MSINLLHRHVLEDHISGFETDPNPNHLSVVRRPVIFSVLAHAGREVAVAEALKAASDLAPRFCGPSEWLAVSQTVGAETIAGLLSNIAGASFVDQSDGKVLMAVSGPSVRKILAKCLAVDLHPDVFGEGHSANMLCCHVAANVARTGSDTFEIIVPRSFAGSVFDELMEMGREHALTRGFSD